MQQPDSTVASEPSFKEQSSFGCDTSSVMSSSHSVPVDSKKPPQIRRASVISLDYDSDHSDSIIDVKPMHSKYSRTIQAESENSWDTPTNPSFSSSKKTSAGLDGSDLFYSPRKPEAVLPNKSETAAADDIPDDFYIDDFDIDDLNDSDIPGYFDESPGVSESSAVTTTVKEGGPSKSSWEKKPTTPTAAPKPAKICSPGKSARHGNLKRERERTGDFIFPHRPVLI